MRITVKRTGGYAGLSEEVAAVDTTRLDPATTQRVERLIHQTDFFNLPAEDASAAAGADMFRYEITASDGKRQHTVAFTEGSPAAAPLVKLVEALQQLA